MRIAVVRIGATEPGLVDDTQRCIENLFSQDASMHASVAIPSESRDARRNQYSSVSFMLALAKANVGDVDRVLGLTECDLFIPMLTFVFGQAQLGGRVALVSLARLRPEFYGADPDGELLRIRLRKEIGHELGHSFGLTHCAARECLMSLATSIQDVDRKSDDFCGSCRQEIGRTI